VVTPQRVKTARRNFVIVSVVYGVLGIVFLVAGLLAVVASTVFGRSYYALAVVGLGGGGYGIWSALRAWQLENRLARGDIPERIQAAMELPPPPKWVRALAIAMVVLMVLVFAGAFPRWVMAVPFTWGVGMVAQTYWRIHVLQRQKRGA